MRSGLLLRLGALAGTAKLTVAECPNACSGSGTCGAYDMCSCYPGYMGNDCSERICPFNLAHVDSPKGDLNMDNAVQYTPDSPVVVGSQMYKDGTSELFPIMKSSDGTTNTNTGHYYMECSNKGLCDRTTGTCSCFVGYDGVSCQRATCPSDCSGNGICKTNRELAALDNGNIYELWDADMSQACECDPGYSGYDCTDRLCEYGIDPLMVDDENTARVPEWTLHFQDSDVLTGVVGTWRLRFFDVFTEDWVTKPLPFNVGCDDLVAELEAIPNDVIHGSTVLCTKTTDASDFWIKYELKFTGNPGQHKVPEIVILDDAGRHTLKDSNPATTSYEGLDKTVVYDTGIVGEFYDFFGQKCGVTLSVYNPQAFYEAPVAFGGYGLADASAEVHYGEVQRAILASGTLRALKECLGDSNGVQDDNIDVENWDYGSIVGDFGAVDAAGAVDANGNNVTILQAVPGQYPHMVKLVDSAASSEFEGGVYTILGYHPADSNFVMSAAVDASKEYQVFATDGVLERVWYDTNGDGVFEMSGDNTTTDIDYDEMGLARWEQYSNIIYTQHDFSCENAGSRGSGVEGTGNPVFMDGVSYLDNNCLEKGDFLVIPSFTTGVDNKDTLWDQDYGNTQAEAQETLNTAGMYEIMKISVEDYTKDTNTTEDRFQITLDRPIFWDGSQVMINDVGTADVDPASGIRQMFRFSPDMGSAYTNQWVAPCSNRGMCDMNVGLCTCFAGYTNENCDTQSALAV